MLVACAIALQVHAADVGVGAPPGSTVAQVESLDRFQAEQDRLRKLLANTPKAYEDKVMNAGSLPPMADADAPPDTDQAGFRGYVSETRFGAARADSGLQLRSASELGHRAEYRRETLNYGDFVAQLDLRSSSGTQGLNVGSLGFATEKSSARITLRNIGLPITPRMFADTSIGDISSEVTDALARSYHASLGSSTVRGLGTRVFARDFDLRAGTGVRGNLAGGPYPGFEETQGRLSWLGYTQRFPDKLYAGVQFNQATGVPDYTQGLFAVPTASLPRQDVNSLAASFGYGYELLQDGDTKARVMLLRSQATAASAAADRNASGVFVEGGFMAGRYRHEVGLYAANPNLMFGDYLLSSDNRGAYWRVDYSGHRLNWGAGLDYEQQNPHHDAGRYAANRIGLGLNAQYQLDRNSSVGGNLNLTEIRNPASGSVTGTGNGSRSVNASVFYQTRFAGWGSSRFTATVRRNESLVFNDVTATGDELRWEHDWLTGKYETMRPEFRTNLGLAHDRSTGVVQTYPTAGVTFRYWADSAWSLAGNLQYTSSTGNLSTSRGLSGSLTTERQLGAGWRMGAAVYLNQAVYRDAGSTFTAPQVSRSNDKSASVYLRWEETSGTPLQAIGMRESGAPGGGSVSGIVYFDANRDGEQQAGENGVPNVEVFLDGRFRVTTDRDGRFDFQMVATGPHQLSLKLESVPLPWGAAPNQRVSVDVPLRGQATARIPVVRVGE